ncbi:hypothetical protein LUZ60_010438 [Juncus effusus]|nr:hypothetical protein LUZ60_010438 [Juncus effusus]
MEGEEIGLVLARASELRSRISDCMEPNQIEDLRGREEGDEEEGSEESLFGICDALESLEQQLASLQDLQHQQRYERETILSQIDRSRRALLSKIREYKGQNWEVINEASLFAGETFDSDDSYPIISPNGKDQNTLPVLNGSDGSRSVWSFVWRVVKTGVLVVGVLGAIKVTGFQPLVWRSSTDFEADGVARCVAKRRVTAPFESGVRDPNISYGSG